MRSVELFAGVGGLAMGVSRAGFRPEAVIDWDRWCCDTIRENQQRGVKPVTTWPEPFHGDARTFDYGAIRAGVDLIAGGPPCQPFSLGGNHLGHRDDRDMFPEAVRAVRELRPRAFFFENVRGLVRQSFARYFEYVILQLTYPEITNRAGETRQDHQTRLERYHTRGKRDSLYYRIVFRVLNAANFGVPQRRERVIIVGFRNDLDFAWSFPERTHSHEALLYEQWITGDYWERHAVPKNNRPRRPKRQRVTIERLHDTPLKKPWRTVRDAIADLPHPKSDRDLKGVFNHRLNPGARAYLGHTGSPMDEPAKTLKAGDHGVPGGENMVVFPNGRIRYFTVRESARLQTFPDDYIFPGSWTECMRQLGNAVPVDLSNTIANSIRLKLVGDLRPRAPR